jgi:hypothetical protein
MDASMIVKILIAIVVVFILFKLWESFSKGKFVIPNPYKKAEGFMNSAEGYEYDMEDDDIYYPETDMEDDDIVNLDGSDMYDGETDDIVNLEGSDMYDGEDDDIYVQEGDDMQDAEDEVYDDTADNETSGTNVPKVMQPLMPILTPASQLLPKPSPDTADFDMWAPKNLQAQNFLTATQWIGVNTQGSSLKNANYDLRADPIIPKADVGPWYMSSVDPNIYQKPLFG